MFPSLRFLFLTAVFLTVFSVTASADDVVSLGGLMKGFKQGKFFLFRDDPIATPIYGHRPDKTSDEDTLRAEAKSQYIPATSVVTDGISATTCIETNPANRHAYARHIGRMARVLSAHVAAPVETFTFQPFYNGLKGRAVTVMRGDVERAVNDRGSPQEIFHNAFFTDNAPVPCGHNVRLGIDTDIIHHIDLFDSDKSPLVRSNAVVRARVSFAGNFMGTLGLRTSLYDNLGDEPDLFVLTRADPIRQDEVAFAWEKTGLENLMISGFATPRPDTYVAVHAGYIEEKFFGIGGEFLYRPYDSPFSWGAEAWGTYKRYPFGGGYLKLDTDNAQFSLLANMHYDIPHTKTSLGLSAGRFLDGDLGVQGIILYRPDAGWHIEGFATLTNEKDHSLDNDKETNLTAGLRVTMPIGKLAILPHNSRQTFNIEPFARDKGQRVHNVYSLYGLTDNWSAQNLYNHWDRILD